AGTFDVHPVDARPNDAPSEKPDAMNPEGGSVDDAAGRADGGTKPPDGNIPKPAGACPEFAAGEVTFHPAEGARNATLFMSDAAKSLHGPIIFYWYGTGGQPSQAQTAFGSSLADIVAAGGIVVAPTHTNAGTFPWISGDVNLEYLLADEIVGCAAT